MVTDPSSLWAPLPDHWARSSIDSIAPLADASPFVAREGLIARGSPRQGIIATVTRWHRDGQPYQHIQAMYVLTREEQRLGIKVLVELITASR